MRPSALALGNGLTAPRCRICALHCQCGGGGGRAPPPQSAKVVGEFLTLQLLDLCKNVTWGVDGRLECAIVVVT